jgi:hypothetical protein
MRETSTMYIFIIQILILTVSSLSWALLLFIEHPKYLSTLHCSTAALNSRLHFLRIRHAKRFLRVLLPWLQVCNNNSGNMFRGRCTARDILMFLGSFITLPKSLISKGKHSSNSHFWDFAAPIVSFWSIWPEKVYSGLVLHDFKLKDLKVYKKCWPNTNFKTLHS